MICHYDSPFERYPYISRVPISTGEKNLCFVYQFAEDAKRYRINTLDTFYIVDYISGPPTNFPEYGNISESFRVGNCCGYDISISSWRANVPWNRHYIQFAKTNVRKISYIELKFHEHVYPIRVSIYEVYNPGNIIKIWAQDSQSKWFPLWEGLTQRNDHQSRLFSPPLQSCNFKTNRLRLEFEHSVDSCTKLDAVMLIGTSELILPRKILSAESLTDLLKNIKSNDTYFHRKDVHNLTEDYENAHLDIMYLQNNFPKLCIICKSDVGKIFHKDDLWYKKALYYIPDVRKILSITQRYLHRLLNYYAKFMDESKELSPFSTLPDEVILEILKHLDLETLYCMNQVNRRFCNLTLDPRLYTRLNMRNIPCPAYIQNILDESKELSPFSTLPDEVILEILKHLDLETLCRMNQVDRRFYNLTLDPRLYTRLNMGNIPCPTYIQNIFCYFTPRCKYLQQLNVTECNLSFPAIFLQFLENCGRHLTHLQLRNCVGVDHNFALKISEICKNLKVLDLPQYREPEDNYLKKLTNPKHLKLDSTICMGVKAFINTLRNVNNWVEKLDVHVRFGPGMSLDYVAAKLERSCFYLKIINIEGNYVVSHIDCPFRKNLVRKKLEIQIVDDSLNILLSSCQLLEELYLSDFHIGTDRNLKLLAECKNLEHLHLNYVVFETPKDVSIIIEQCPKLQKFCLVGSNVSRNLIHQWEESHPHVLLQTDFIECWP